MTSCVTFTRGGTVYWTTTFCDINGIVVQPDSATINLIATKPNGDRADPVLIPMIPPFGTTVTWTAEWDSRGVGFGTVYWSIHTGTIDPIPVAVEDGSFVLTANPANLLTF